MPTWLTQLLGGGIVDKLLAFIPNPAEKAKAELELHKALMDAAIGAEKDQRDINKVEAGSSSLFIAGWRPAVGWLCVGGLGWQFFLSPMATWFLLVMGFAHPLPMLGDATLTDLLYALLGIGSMRTMEKVVPGSLITKAIGAVSGRGK